MWKILKTCIPFDPQCYFQEFILKRNLKRHIKTCTQMSLLQNLHIVKYWETSNCTAIKDQMHKIWYLWKCHIACMHAKSLQSLWDSMDCSPPGSCVHGILQARILEWVAMPSSRGSSQPKDWMHISYVSCISGQILYHEHHLESVGEHLWTRKMFNMKQKIL